MKPTPASARMRRLGVSLWLCFLIQAVAPAPALAWWGWLDKWSGPGPFTGWLVEVRLACFGPSSGYRELRAALRKAQAASRAHETALNQRTLGETQLRQSELDAQKEWQDLLDAILKAEASFPIASKSQLEEVKTLGTQLANPGKLEVAAINTAIEQAALAVTETRAVAVTTMAGTGVLWSLCSPERRRAFSIEAGFDYWSTRRPNPEFAGGEDVKFVTFMPSFTWRVLSNPKYDVLDIGAGAGKYWFSSRGFDSFSGLIVQPIRLDIHGPTVWTRLPKTDIRRLAAATTFRMGLMTAPAGFEAGAFGPGVERIPAELVFTWAVFFNARSLLGSGR